MGGAFSTSWGQADIPLWADEPSSTWLRTTGRTRVILIDDQWASRRRLLDVSDGAPLTPGETMLRDWLNVDLDFFPMPDDYVWKDVYPSGSFTDSWFENSLLEVKRDSRPVAAFFLDLLFGKERGIADASGRRFLGIIRRHFPDTPVIVMSSMAENREVLGRLKEGVGGEESESFSSFQDYLPKVDPYKPDQALLERVAYKLVEWGDLADPSICAFAPSTRRLARRLRQVVIRDERIEYEMPGGKGLPRPVTLTGDYGAGKNFIAQWLVRTSSRRTNPFHVANFADATDEGMIPALFGSLMYTGAAECIHVDPTDGAVIERSSAHGTPRRSPRGTIAFGSLGYLHRADIADQPVPGAGEGRQQPLKGSLLFDELGAASDRMQTLLLGVLNGGRFAPHLGSQAIPTHRTLDVWFLVTATAELHERFRGDLRSRLARGYQLRIPSLGERRQDVLPLILSRMPYPPPDHPEDVFTEQAVELILDSSQELQVRDVLGALLNLQDVSAKRPYGVAELRRALEYTRSSHASSRLARRKHQPDRRNTQFMPQPDSSALDLLAEWNGTTGPAFPTGVSSKETLRGRGQDVDGGVAAARLAYFERAVQFSESVSGEVSVTRTYLFAYGKRVSATLARDKLAAIFETDYAQTLNALRSSDALLRLAIDIAKRRRKVQTYLEVLHKEADHQDRLARFGWKKR